MNDEIEILYREYGSFVFDRCFSLLKNEEDAIDATHDLFVRLLSQNELSIETPLAFLSLSATRICLNRIRNRKTRKTEADSELIRSIATIDDGESRSIARQILSIVFSNNPVSSQWIAVLHFVDGLTLQQTADYVGMSVSGVQKRLRKLRQELQLELESES